jgi:SanA protein
MSLFRQKFVLRILFFLTVFALLAASPFLWQRWVQTRYQTSIFAADTVQTARVAIVFGARVYGNGRLSGMLRDRVDTAIDLYKTGKVQKLLLSGDNQFADYDEPSAMMDYALAHGVPERDIQPDYAGRRTYDTCYRAKAVFQVKTAILVTQQFHLPRALFLCDQLGLTAVGVAADRRTYDPRSVAFSETREVPALFAALFDAIRRAPPPVLGPPIPLE